MKSWVSSLSSSQHRRDHQSMLVDQGQWMRGPGLGLDSSFFFFSRRGTEPSWVLLSSSCFLWNKGKGQMSDNGESVGRCVSQCSRAHSPSLKVSSPSFSTRLIFPRQCQCNNSSYHKWAFGMCQALFCMFSMLYLIFMAILRGRHFDVTIFRRGTRKKWLIYGPTVDMWGVCVSN